MGAGRVAARDMHAYLSLDVKDRDWNVVKVEEVKQETVMSSCAS